MWCAGLVPEGGETAHHSSDLQYLQTTVAALHGEGRSPHATSALADRQAHGYSLMKIDIGGGTLSPEGWINLDPVHGSMTYGTGVSWRRRAQDTPWPPADGEVEAVRASHVLEHIPSGADRIAVMNEAHRVLRSGGTFEIILPLVGYTDRDTGAPMSNQIGWQPWSDPTHVSFWWFPESLLYFCEGPFKPHADYGIREWKLIEWHVVEGWEGHATLMKP